MDVTSTLSTSIPDEDSYDWGPSFFADGVRFRLWAPAASTVELELDGQRLPMRRDAEGWWETFVRSPRNGASYCYLVDGKPRPDPASRGQADGVDGPSLLHDPDSYRWSDDGWKGRPWEDAIVYELHVGAFTGEGTFRAAIDRLDDLAELGITAVELMPVAHFPGNRGWGYDGVLMYAPHRAYGTPDDFKALVDAAHARGLMVFLDVVYNHFGPQGNYLGEYAPDFFHVDRATPWGARIDYANPAVRAYFVENVLYWLREFHLDGLRLDAVDEIHDGSPHILEEVARRVHAEDFGRQVHLITENPSNGTDLIAARPDGVRLYRADWNDEFHHAMHVAATGETNGYYAPFADRPWEKVGRALAYGYLRAGKPIIDAEPPPTESLPPTAFVHFLHNHDQIGNRLLADRSHLALDRDVYQVWMAILLLSPQIPMLFMGEDRLDDTPFHFFTDYEGALARAVHEGRGKEMEKFGGTPAGQSATTILDPSDIDTFLQSKLTQPGTLGEDERTWRLFLKELLDVRRTEIIPLLADATGYSGQSLAASERCIAVDWRLAGRQLSLRANFSDMPRRLPPASGRLVYALPELGGNDQKMVLQPISMAMFAG